MAFSEISGTQTIALADAEHSFATDTTYDTGDAQTTDGLMMAYVDMNDMGSGDQFKLRVYEKCRSGDTQRICGEWLLTAAQTGSPVGVTPALLVMHGWDVTGDTTIDSASGIAINWDIRTIPVTITEISGTQTPLDADAEHSMATDTTYDSGDAQTTDGSLQIWLDVNAMVYGDRLRVRLYEKARSGDTQRITHEWILTATQQFPLWFSPIVPVMHGWDATIETLADAASGIAVNWSLRLAPVT